MPSRHLIQVTQVPAARLLHDEFLRIKLVLHYDAMVVFVTV